MWEDNDADDGDEDEDEEDEGLAGQLLSDLIASNKYGSAHSSCVSFLILSNALFHVFFSVPDDDYYEDDEEDDPDALKDPIYQIDLQVRSF